jgi:hypothetical protein
MRQIQALADCTIGQALRGHRRDLHFLRKELVPELRCALLTDFARRAQFLTCSLCPRRSAQRVKGVARRSQRSACIRYAVLTRKPDTVGQLKSRALKGPAVRLRECLAITLFEDCVVRQVDLPWLNAQRTQDELEFSTSGRRSLIKSRASSA